MILLIFKKKKKRNLVVIWGHPGLWASSTKSSLSRLVSDHLWDNGFLCQMFFNSVFIAPPPFLWPPHSKRSSQARDQIWAAVVTSGRSFNPLCPAGNRTCILVLSHCMAAGAPSYSSFDKSVLLVMFQSINETIFLVPLGVSAMETFVCSFHRIPVIAKTNPSHTSFSS